jgi:methylated-DNA-protein-cysteine methyltransferase-like protein
MFEKMYDVVREIPAGRVATYGQVARLAGFPHCARMAGYAMSAAPPSLGLPCHRVVNRLGTLAHEHIFGGLQRLMLEEEGVTFLENGRIDMGTHLWEA